MRVMLETVPNHTRGAHEGVCISQLLLCKDHHAASEA